ncbi:hypothetical protein HYV44_03250 [Candidatus Microgenomates bacterium]|nr:hypothetical protein [Candidatus Microgenomates bacterium]
MKIDFDITEEWNRYVAKGLIKNVFESHNGKIEAGLRLGPNGPEQYVVDLATGRDISEPPICKHCDNGIDFLYDHFGGLKPHTPSKSPGKQDDLLEDADSCIFACQNQNVPHSVLRRTPLLQVELPGSKWFAFPNLTPWESRGLLLWVPVVPDGVTTTFPHRPQGLTRASIEDFLEISQSRKDLVTFFNSLHGGASVNHLHFQSVYSDHKMAVELAALVKWEKYTLVDGYFAPALFFALDSDIEKIWEPIEKIQQAGIPYDLIALSSGTYLFIRNINHEIVEEFPGRGLGGINFAGLIITADKKDFTRVTEQVIRSAFAKATIDPRKLDFL